MDDTPAILWFRRDLRLTDHAALHAAAERSGRVQAVFVLDDALLDPAGNPRLAFMHGCLRALDDQLGGRLLVTHGDPAAVMPRLAADVGADRVYIHADTGPYGRKRDAAVRDALARNDIELVEAGSSYAVTPGRVLKADGTPYRVFTPFFRAWKNIRLRPPADTSVSTVDWMDPGQRGVAIPKGPHVDGLPEPGEKAALALWRRFLDDDLLGYDVERDRIDHDGTTRLSPYLRWGCVHPRTLLADLAGRDGAGAASLRAELAWREFHADVLWHRPDAARHHYDKRFDAMEYDTGADAEELFLAWREGRTGYPIVDAGMRHLSAVGWMHNRLRMVVASFLVKDLHLPWQWGARHFMRTLVDGDLASNQLNWQWVAGSGTDAAPYFRVFNPTTQGEKFDPRGDYVRRHVPELAEVPGKAVHQPWKLPGGPPKGYPAPVVEHAEERRVALARYGAITG